MKFEKLLSPITIRGTKFENRIVFPAMGTKMPTVDKFSTQQIIDYHVERVKGGSRINIVEVCSVHEPSAPKAFLSLGDDKYIPELKKLTEAIHQAGAKVGIQLWQGGLAVASDQEAIMVLADPMPVPGTEYTIPAATKETLDEIVVAFGKATARAVEAGFDFVEFHCAHNYSPHSFLSPAFNHRQDEFGGSFENRAKYPIACIKSIRKNLRDDMPLFMRIDAHDDYVENGLTIEDVIEFCKLAGENGVDVLDISRGNIVTAAIKYEVPSIDIPRGFNVENASKIRKETGLITIAVGRINDPAQAEEILANDKADLVVIGRGQLADPEFINKASEGREDEIIKCVACNQGCFDGFVDPSMPHITCLRNPALGREEEFRIKKAEKKKKVLVVGGGMAGLEAALILCQKGHEVTIAESSNDLGGQFLLAGVAPRKQEMTEAAKWMAKAVEREGANVLLNQKVDREFIKAGGFDEVILAIGAKPIELDIEGINLPKVVDSHSLLAGDVHVKEEVAVIGGGLVGLEVAEYLRSKGHKVTVIEMLQEVGKDLGQLRKISVMENLYTGGIHSILNAKCEKITEEGVIVERDGAKELIKADSVVIAVGAKSRSTKELAEACERLNIHCHIIGDANKARRALNATAEAMEVALKI